ncbi:MAG: glycosyltransferase family 4 protein [Gemmatimonadales bacterium]
MNGQVVRDFLGPAIMKPVDALRHELRYRPAAIWSRFNSARENRSKRALLLRSFDEIRENPPAVLIGPNIGGSNGITHHMSAIRQFSRLKVAISPPDWLMKELSHHDLHTTFRDDVMNFEPKGTRVIHSHVFPYFIQWCRRHRESVSLWVHTYHSPFFPIGPDVPLEAWQTEYNRVLVEEARYADVRISVSKWQQEYLLEQHGIETLYVPNGVNVALCDLGSAERFRKRYGQDRFILYVGRNEPVKNPADFVRLAQRMPGERFMMIGSGLTPEALSTDWDVECPSNLLLAGSASHLEVQDALAAAAVVVVTSLREGLPTLVLEAMAHRRNTVVPDEPGSVEAVAEGKFGTIYSPGDVDDLAAKVADALGKERDFPMAREHVLETYDWRVVAPKLDAIYSGHR